MKIIRPPEYPIDAKPVWIDNTDPAWDLPRIKREREVLIASVPALEIGPAVTEDERAKLLAAHEERKVDAGLRHPISVWYTGRSRFSETAILTIPVELRTPGGETTATIADYMVNEPARFPIRYLTRAQYRRITKLEMDDGLYLAVKYGLERIETADDSGAAVILEPARDQDGGITDAWLDGIDRQDRALIRSLGASIFYGLNSTRWEAEWIEGKP